MSALCPTTGNNRCVVNASCACVKDKIYSFGGFHFVSDVVYNDLHVLNLADNTWKTIVHIRGVWPVKRTDHTMTVWGDDRLVIFGGSDTNETFLNDVFILNLTHLTWEKLDCSGAIPTGRAKHSAVIYKDMLIISGGCQRKDEDISNQVNILDLNSGVWDQPRDFIRRHAHNSWAYRDRLYIYGGFDENMDRVKSLSFLDLLSGSSVIISIDSPDAPCHLEQQRVESLGQKLLVVGIPLHWRGSDDATQMHASGLWSLDLEDMRWQRLADGQMFQSVVWHYHIINPSQSQIILLGENPSGDEEGFMSNILTINLESYGICTNLKSSISDDFREVLNMTHLADFKITSSSSPEAVGIPTHKLVLIARWPYFANLVGSGMSEATTNKLVLDDSMETISLFVHYLYTDTLLTASPRMYADTMVMANRYCLWRLQRLCSAAILATPSDMDSLWVFICATKTHELLLRERSLKYILANFGMISKCPDFRALSTADIDELWNALPDSAKLVVY
ncbi:hypothetical protein BASA50_010368 [Batrachochytrium salamandrivorans]|uniref:BTB domain-containing protein n=1 Tax=Batrachochytrium salamandrivorans TaxID=1357716 RepID=A0ABQ8F1K6_9FUNG|nr:hypothetical protein BASA62_009118 [Batrachochytrium salamandrivorans]KAH6574967.1 hypothetical protein BASA60_005226 [Batrachochytrium salamandrivorans]KAH6588947.1 hypothetical protein BASA50_010368 [Batrachochytrium salamandrivorans]KAH9266261.1 hypothetical protein BASA83_010739 [Batrachochytrium salamandrivorans]